jgi:acyl-CoA reductase-like NAD-dependent aldehyde dehydrogenase
MSLLGERWTMEMYFNGKFTAGNSSERIEVINPATEEVIGDSPGGIIQDVV